MQEKTRIYQIWLDRIIELPSTLSLWRSWCSVPFSGISRNDLFCFMLDVIHLYFVCSKRHKIIYFCILKIMIENIQNVICTIQKLFLLRLVLSIICIILRCFSEIFISEAIYPKLSCILMVNANDLWSALEFPSRFYTSVKHIFCETNSYGLLKTEIFWR